MNDSERLNVVLRKPDSVEKIAGSKAISIGAAALGALAGDLAGLVPALLDSLARGRQMERVEQSLCALQEGLNALGDLVYQMSDDQYKVVAESAAAMFSTLDPEKLTILRAAALQAVKHPDAVAGDSDAIGRLLRDLSTAEVRFLIKYKDCNSVGVGQKESCEQGRLLVKGGSAEEGALSGLISLGVLFARAATWDEQMYEWAPVVPKLLQVLQDEAT